MPYWAASQRRSPCFWQGAYETAFWICRSFLALEMQRYVLYRATDALRKNLNLRGWMGHERNRTGILLRLNVAGPKFVVWPKNPTAQPLVIA